MDWLAGHWRVVLGVFAGLMAGAVVGWILGSYTSCGDDCEIRAQSVEAVGTWVGGLGTIAAVLAAVVAFRSEEAARRASDRQNRRIARHQDARERSEAAQMKLVVDALGSIGQDDQKQVSQITVTILNENPETDAYFVRGRSTWWGELKGTDTLKANSGVATNVGLGGPGEPALAVPDDIDHWKRIGIENIVIEFDMNGRRWRRQGTSMPVPVPDPDDLPDHIDMAMDA